MAARIASAPASPMAYPLQCVNNLSKLEIYKNVNVSVIHVPI